MFAVTVTFQIHKASIDLFTALVRANAAKSLGSEPGCSRFDVCMTSVDPSEVFLYEIYDSQSAFEAHLLTDHFKAFNRATEGMIASKDVRSFDEVFS